MAIYHRDGAAAALAAAKLESWPNRDGRVFFILTHLAATEPEFTAAELEASGLDLFLKTALVDTVLKHWKDGRKALEWAENQLTGELHCKAVAGALGILVKSEPDAAFGYLEAMPASEARLQTIRELFSAWGSYDPESALTTANQLTSKEVNHATEHILRGWAMNDPEAAAAWVLETAPKDGKWIAGVYQSWIAKAPEKAQLWFDSLPEGDAKKNAHTFIYSSSGFIIVEVSVAHTDLSDHLWASKPVSERDATDLRNWAIQDTEAARSYVEQNGNDPGLRPFIAEIARAIFGKNGPTDAIHWALQLPDASENQEVAIRVVFDEWCEKDPVAAGEMLASMSPEQTGIVPIYLVNRWLKNDPAAAADWVARWSGEKQPIMIERVIDAWPDQDPNAAYQWLGSLPAGAGRDAGIKTMILRERESAPETLLPWIDQISDPQLREKAHVELHEFLKAARDR